MEYPLGRADSLMLRRSRLSQAGAEFQCIGIRRNGGSQQYLGRSKM